MTAQNKTQPCPVTGCHAWRTVSRHLVHDGVTCYQQCACGQWRMTVVSTVEPA